MRAPWSSFLPLHRAACVSTQIRYRSRQLCVYFIFSEFTYVKTQRYQEEATGDPGTVRYVPESIAEKNLMSVCL